MVVSAPIDDTPAITLACAYPLLLKDVSDWVRGNPASSRFTQPGQPINLTRRSMEYLVNWPDPARVAERLDEAALWIFSPISGVPSFPGAEGGGESIGSTPQLGAAAIDSAAWQ